MVAAGCLDRLVLPILREIRTCAAEQLAICGRLPCRFPITWNEQIPPADACDCECASGQGQAWARWVSTEPSKLGGSSSAMGAAGCADGTYEITLELGLYRCWPVPGEGRALDEAEEEQAAIGLLMDAAELRRALFCCAYLEEQQWELIKEEPVAHSGGCTGVSVQLRVIASDCECSDFSSTPPELQAAALNLLGRPEA